MKAEVMRLVVQRTGFFDTRAIGDVMRGRSRTRVNWPEPSAFSAISPAASSVYEVMTIPASAHRCKTQSMWHVERDATSNSSGL